jgi:REP element-mobilizing transposase RayT
MANTYSQIHIQIVFAVKYRKASILPSFEDNVYKIITGIIQNKGHKLLAINGVEDHIHIFFGIKPICNLSELVREIKKSSTAYINGNNFLPYKFQWQEGFGAFSYSNSHVDRVCKYVRNQKIHHAKKSFKEEYHLLLKNLDVDFDDKYIFQEMQ